MESTAVKTGTEPKTSKRVELPVQGMSCASCVATVEGGLRRTPGVREAAVNLAAERASVIFDPQALRLEDLIKAVEDTGYAVPVERVVIPVQGLEVAGDAPQARQHLLPLRGAAVRRVGFLGGAHAGSLPHQAPSPLGGVSTTSLPGAGAPVKAGSPGRGSLAGQRMGQRTNQVNSDYPR